MGYTMVASIAATVAFISRAPELTSGFLADFAKTMAQYCKTLTITFLCLSHVICDENEYRLVRDMMTRYEKRIRPSTNHTQPMNVTFGVALAQIIDVDEKNQIITTNCWLNLNWMDNMLKWEPRKYGNISIVRLPFGDVWKPDILLYNNADVGSSVSSVSTNVIVQHDGNVTWLSMWIFKSSCSMDVRYFPFDVQNCSMNFASWTFDGFQINLVNNAETGDASNYVESSEWELLKFSFQRDVVVFSCCPEPYVFMKYNIVLKRKPLFYIFNMVMPCVLITLVALLGFYMPSDSGEKISMGITTLLSMTVFLMIVAERLPPVSDVVPLIGLYYGITIAIVSFATAMNVFTLNIHHKGIRGYEVPSTLKRIFFGIIAKMLFIKMDLPDRPPHPGMQRVPTGDYYKYDTDVTSENGGISPRFARKVHTPSSDTCEKQFLKVLQKVNLTIERNEERLAEQDRRDYIKQEWQQLALVLDRLLMVLFIMLLLCVSLSLLVPGNSYTGSDDSD